MLVPSPDEGGGPATPCRKKQPNNTLFVQVYAPMEDASNADKDPFYNDLLNCIQRHDLDLISQIRFGD